MILAISLRAANDSLDVAIAIDVSSMVLRFGAAWGADSRTQNAEKRAALFNTSQPLDVGKIVAVEERKPLGAYLRKRHFQLHVAIRDLRAELAALALVQAHEAVAFHRLERA